MIILFIGKMGSGKSTAANYLVSKKGFKEDSFACPLKQIALQFGFEYEELYGSIDKKNKINKYWGISGREFMQKFGTEVCRVAMPNIIPQMHDVWVRLMEKRILATSTSNIGTTNSSKSESETKVIDSKTKNVGRITNSGTIISDINTGLTAPTTTNNIKLVISDGRFPDEIALIKKMGGIIVRIVRGNDAPPMPTSENTTLLVPITSENITSTTLAEQHVSESYIDGVTYDVTIYNNGSLNDFYKKLDAEYYMLHDRQINVSNLVTIM